MNLIDYMPLAMRTEKQLPTNERLQHGCLGLITEAGEIVTEIKRTEIYKKELSEDRMVHICEEIGDIVWYVAIFVNVLQIEPSTLEYQPRMPRPEEGEDSDKMVVLSMVLGEHIGRICFGVMKCEMQGVVTLEDKGLISASIGMVLEICRIAAEHCNSTLEKCLEDNIAKLRIRYPDAYSNEAAEARADKAGADARNS